MRFTNPTQVRLLDTQPHGLTFAGSRGERFQVSVLEEDLIRVQHWPDGAPRLDRTWMVVGRDGDVPREGRLRDDLRPFSLPPFELEVEGDRLRVRTSAVHLTVALGDFALSWSDANGRTFAADTPGRAYAYDRGGRAVFHYMERRQGEHYYGFGERSGPLDKAGMRMRMQDLDALGYHAGDTDPLYKHFPFYITFIPELQIAYGLFYDNLATTTFDMGRELDAYNGLYRYYQAEDGDIDCYLIFGPSIPRVVERFSALTGRMVLPPRWSLGYLAATMMYTEADDAQQQLARFIELTREKEIPCDAFQMSSGVTMGKDQRRYVFNWNRDRVPDVRAMSKAFHDAGMHLSMNIKPCLLTTHPYYQQLRDAGAFIREADSDDPHVTAFWGGQGSYVDFTNPEGYEWWQERVKDCVLEYGIDATWNDNNECEVWDDEARCAGFGAPIRVGLIRPLQALLMTRASYEAQVERQPGLRPYLVSRSGCPGIQRYAQTWSGDNSTSWDTLRFNIPMGLGISLSGAPNTGHDVGGFYGMKPDPELFVRWVQNGIFHPRFTIHSWHTDGTVNEPWMYPEVLPLIREAISFRYRLIPYLYTLLFEAAHTGHPVIRPMVYTFPGDARTHTESFDFMLGPNLLVASVLEEGARTRPVYLPGDGSWYDFYTGAHYPAGQTVVADAPLDRIPLFVPAGGIVPMGKPMRHVGEQPDDLRQAFVYPHPVEGRGAFTLIEDDGLTLGYSRGEYKEVTLEVVAQPGRVDLRAEARGAFHLPYSHVEFVLPRGETRPVESRGETWIDEEGRRHVAVPVREP